MSDPKPTEWMQKAAATIGRLPLMPNTREQVLCNIASAIASAYAPEEAAVQGLQAKLAAYKLLLTARSWGAVVAACVKSEPDVARIINEHNAYIKAEALFEFEARRKK